MWYKTWWPHCMYLEEIFYQPSLFQRKEYKEYIWSCFAVTIFKDEWYSLTYVWQCCLIHTQIRATAETMVMQSQFNRELCVTTYRSQCYICGASVLLDTQKSCVLWKRFSCIAQIRVLRNAAAVTSFCGTPSFQGKRSGRHFICL